MEPATVILDSKGLTVLSNLVHLNAPSMVHAVMANAFVVQDGLEMTAPLELVLMIALETVFAKTLLVIATLDSVVRIVVLSNALMTVLDRELVTMGLAIVNPLSVGLIAPSKLV